MQKSLFILLVIFISSCSESSNSIEQQWVADDKEVITDRIQTYYNDLSDRNWEAFDDHFWDKSIMATVWQATPETDPQLYTETTVEFIKQAHMGPGSKPIFEEKMTDMKVMQHGNLAIVWANYDARFGNENNIDTWSGIDAFSMLRHKGEWKIISLSYAAVD